MRVLKIKKVRIVGLMLVFAMLFSYMGVFAEETSTDVKDVLQMETNCVYATEYGYAYVTQEQFDEIWKSDNRYEKFISYNTELIPYLNSYGIKNSDLSKTENMDTQETITREIGSWNISKNTIKAGYVTNYYKPGGSKFSVNEGNAIRIMTKQGGFFGIGSKGLIYHINGPVDNSIHFDSEPFASSHNLIFDFLPAGQYGISIENPNDFSVELYGTIMITAS